MDGRRGRLVLAAVVAVAIAAATMTFTNVAAVAGSDCVATRDVLVSSLAAAEGTKRDGGTTTMTLTVVSRGCPVAGTVVYALRPGTTDTRDLTTYSTGVLTFAEGDMRDQAITVDVRADALVEPDEDFSVALVSIRGALRACDSMATVTILNDDAGEASSPPALPIPHPSYTTCELHSSR